ncbi:hypothetical protein CHARACLAT_015472 [Characodon lateralis]|uniref:Dynein heavy chain tail domain-containing protein n=1 Tax=Characodon lateralis TaxID=208331 RepID=A0ABU7DAN5_9TELE|nr:hypothetical protein [Characodon lateralis]
MLIISNYQANVYLGPEEVLKGETAESLLRVKTSLEVLQLFRSTYEDHRANLRKYQKNGTMVKPWDFSTLLVFSRLDQFIKRVQNIKDILSTSLDLMKLEKLEIGGIRGRALSLQIQLLYQEFLESYKFFTDKPYDCLDITNMEFEGDVRDFKLMVDDTDRRLGAIFCQAFDDASGLEHTFKVLEMFVSLIERPLIAVDAMGRYPIILKMFDKELDTCKLIFNKQNKATKELGSAPVHKNMPVVAGGLRWAYELQQRIQVPFSKLRHLFTLCLESAEGAMVIQKYEEMMQLLDRYSAGLYTTWTEVVGESSQYNLSLPLISRDSDTQLISVNFNPQVFILISHA